VIEFEQQSLPIVREIGDRQLEIATLARLGLAYATLRHYAKAIEFFGQLILKHRLGVPLTILGVALCIVMIILATILWLLIVSGVVFFISMILATIFWQRMQGIVRKTMELHGRAHSD
jgi:ABC-type bacteriocin/lantibiotic exporter with double-glycine peptidase domain